MNFKQFLNENKEPTVKLTIPLLIRIMEWAHEDAKDDVEIHQFVEKMIEHNKSILSTDDYKKFL